MPERIQRSRTRGWRMPEGAVYVGRPTKWGNTSRVLQANGGWAVSHDNGATVGTFPDDREARRFAVEAYRAHLAAHPDLVLAARRDLTGKDLACWCPLDQPCHADVLLELANTDTAAAAEVPATTAQTPNPSERN